MHRDRDIILQMTTFLRVPCLYNMMRTKWDLSRNVVSNPENKHVKAVTKLRFTMSFLVAAYDQLI